MRLVLIVSGPIAVGKSAFIGEMLKRFNAVRISTRELIQEMQSVPSERGALQAAGESLDRDTDGKWLSDALIARASKFTDNVIVIVDSARIPKQVEHLRAAYRDRIWHVHLTASYEVLSSRFMKRKESGDPAVRDFASYDESRANATEAGVEKLAEIADEVIETDDRDAGTVAALAAEKIEQRLKSDQDRRDAH